MELKNGKLILSFIIHSMVNLGISPMHRYLNASHFIYFLIVRIQHEI